MDKKSGAQLLLSPLRVLDLTGEKGYYLCSKVLGDLGAEVTRLERPGTKRDFWWWAYNHEKKVVPFDIEKDKDKLLQLVKEADFLIEDFPPGYLDSQGLGYAALRKANPRLIMASLTSFGQTGPYRDLKADDLELMALSGVLYGIGDADRAPVRISFPQSHVLTSAEAAVGVMVALYWREQTGQGQHVDVSAHESVHAVMTGAVSRKKQEVAGSSRMRIGPNHPPVPGIGMAGARPHKYEHPVHPQIWQCKDGSLAFLLHSGMRGAHNNRGVVKHMEADGNVPEIIGNIQWETFDPYQTSPEDMAKIWGAFADFFKRHTRKELYEIAVKERIELFTGSTLGDILTNDQLESRHFWQTLELPEFGKTVKTPGPFAQLFSPDSTGAGAPQPARQTDRPRLPFEGVKVLDFTWVYTGPWMTQWLAVFGADVIKVESSSHLDTGRRGNPWGFAAWNSGKKSLLLNLKHAKGQALAQRLVKWADVVTENFTPGTLAKLGFGYDELIKMNPRIVMLSASMFGQNGPHALQPGMGQQLTSLAGFNELCGWPDRGPVSAHGPYTDIIACRIAATTLFAALDYQKRTGKGCYIDVSQFEAALHFLTPLLLEYQATGRELQRMGNRSLDCSPHGVFRCQGKDRWVTITVANESEWQAFCQTTGKPEWGKDPRFATFEARKKNEDELEKLISAWTTQTTAEEVMTRLQKAGIKAGLVADWDDLLKDPQLLHRKHFVPVRHSQLGEYDYSDAGFRLETAPVVNPAPLFGEHNKYVATQILGCSEEEFEADFKAGVYQ
ncbi:MAG: CoA transferase [Chloroflexi bacterium]|nr:CoA transferase [Chloroflexota bacterium]